MSFDKVNGWKGESMLLSAASFVYSWDNKKIVYILSNIELLYANATTKSTGSCTHDKIRCAEYLDHGKLSCFVR